MNTPGSIFRTSCCTVVPMVFGQLLSESRGSLTRARLLGKGTIDNWRIDPSHFLVDGGPLLVAGNANDG